MRHIAVQFAGIDRITVPISGDWQIIYHQFFNISPEAAALVPPEKGVAVWDVCFLQDLLQIKNLLNGNLLDVGWTPHADPAGAYRVRLLQCPSPTEPIDWRNPIRDVRTRSLADVLSLLSQLTTDLS